MPMFQDANGNPIIITVDQLLQRMFDPFRDAVRTTARNAATVLSVSSAAITANQASASLYVGPFAELAIDVSITAVTGTTPTYQLIIERLGADGVWYPIYTGSTITAAGTVTLHLGAGLPTNVSFGSTIRVREVVGGTTPSFTRSVSVVGK